VSDDFDEYRSRYYWFGGLELSTSLFKVYNLGGLEWKKIKHQISPTITFRYVPQIDDPAPTSFAGRVGAVEKIDYKIVTTLTAKKVRGLDHLKEIEDELWKRRYLGALASWGLEEDKFAGTTDEELDEEYQRRLRLHRLNQSPTYAYDEFFRLELRQSFDLREARLPKTAGQERRPFSTIRADLQFRPSRYLNHRATAEFQPYDRRFLSLYLYLDMYDKRGDYFGLQYRRRVDEDSGNVDMHQIRADLRLKIRGPWSAGAQFIYNLAAKKPISQTINLSFQRQCWGLAASYYHSSDDSRVAVVFSLFGIGDVYRYEHKVGQRIQ